MQRWVHSCAAEVEFAENSSIATKAETAEPRAPVEVAATVEVEKVEVLAATVKEAATVEAAGGKATAATQAGRVRGGKAAPQPLWFSV